jgi:hypothetical protein
MPLAANDPVLICINAMPDLLRQMPVNCLLTNGKIEKQLKCFLGAAWTLRLAEVSSLRRSLRHLD